MLEEKLHERVKKEIFDVINEVLSYSKDDTSDDVIKMMEEKFEKRLTEEISKVRVEIVNTEQRLRVEIANTKADMIKWMFIFWIGNIVSILGGIITILKLVKVF